MLGSDPCCQVEPQALGSVTAERTGLVAGWATRSTLLVTTFLDLEKVVLACAAVVEILLQGSTVLDILLRGIHD